MPLAIAWGFFVPEFNRALNWPFADPPDFGVFTTVQVMREHTLIRFVTHDLDGSWYFFNETDAIPADVLFVVFDRIVALDASVAEMADLPLGWEARRRGADQPWSCYPQPC